MHKVIINRQMDSLLAIGLLLLVLVAAYFVVERVYLEQLADLNHEIELKKRRNAKIDSILMREKELKTRISQQKQVIQKNRIFLNSPKAATAASELQNYVKQLIARQSDAKILTIKPYPVVKYDNYSEASLEIRVTDMGHEGLLNLLYGIETHAPVLVIRELDIKLPQRRYSAMVEPTSQEEHLAVTFVVGGFFRESAEGS